LKKTVLFSLFSSILLLLPIVSSYDITEKEDINFKNEINIIDNITYYNYTWNLSGISSFEFSFNFPKNWKEFYFYISYRNRFTGFYIDFQFDGGYLLDIYYTGLFLLGYKISKHFSWVNNNINYFYGEYYHIFKGIGFGYVNFTIKLIT
jgi:hypothetical protein